MQLRSEPESQTKDKIVCICGQSMQFVNGLEAIKACETFGNPVEFVVFFNDAVLLVDLPHVADDRNKTLCRRFFEFVYGAKRKYERSLVWIVLDVGNKRTLLVIAEDHPKEEVLVRTQVGKDEKLLVMLRARRAETMLLKKAVRVALEDREATEELKFGPVELSVRPGRTDAQVEIEAESGNKRCLRLILRFGRPFVVSKVENLHKCPGLTGTDVLRVLVDRINLELGVRVSELFDASKVRTPCSPTESYKWWHLARKGKTWYQAHGWQPRGDQPSVWELRAKSELRRFRQTSDDALASFVIQAEDFLLRRRSKLDELLSVVDRDPSVCRALFILRQEFEATSMNSSQNNLVKFYD